MAENKEQPEAKEKSGGTRLVFPQHLAQLIDQDGGYPFVKITNNEDEQAVFLPIPSSLTLADGASYEGLDMGDFKSAENFNSKGGGAAGTTQQDRLALGLRTAASLPGIDKIAKTTLLAKRIAVNPMTELTFSGMEMRNFTMAFEMTPRNEDEADTVGKICHKFRRLMYAEKTGSIGYTVRYPAMFRIQFMSGENESKFFPIIHDCYIGGLDTNFFAQQGAFHRVGKDFMAPKISISLSFKEGKMLTRDDLYGDDGTPKYDRGPMADASPGITDSEVSDAENAGSKED